MAGFFLRFIFDERFASLQLWRSNENALATTLLLTLRSGSATFNVAEGDAALRQIVGRKLERHTITGEDANVVLTHLAVGVSDEFVTVVKLHFVTGVREHFQDLARHLDEIFLCHVNRKEWDRKTGACGDVCLCRMEVLQKVARPGFYTATSQLTDYSEKFLSQIR